MFRISARTCLLMLVLILFSVGILSLRFEKKQNIIPPYFAVEENISRNATDVLVPVDESAFYGAIQIYQLKTMQNDYSLGGGVVPHHNLASPLIAEFFSRLATNRSDIKTFIILGPNHSNVGASAVISCNVNWQVPAGAVSTNFEILNELDRGHYLAIDENHCVSDQAIQTLIPFIENYFPDAEIVPLLFSSKNDNEKVTLLAEEINRISDQSVFVVASLDFSHYLPLAVAEEKDSMTMGAIEDRDFEKIYSFNSDHVDSSYALAAFLRTMDFGDFRKIEVLRHSNSMDFFGQDPNNITSYFSVFMKR
jgi:AmmeMemoRadiSam system protein B